MKTKWYFIIAGAAFLGFASWYQDFHHDDTRRRELLAAAQAEQRAIATERERAAQEHARTRARQKIEGHRREREQAAQVRAVLQDRRDAWRSELHALREENAALHVNGGRLRREIADFEQQHGTLLHDSARVASEEKFLQGYIAEATASAARIESVIVKLEALRVATAGAPASALHPH